MQKLLKNLLTTQNIRIQIKTLKQKKNLMF